MPLLFNGTAADSVADSQIQTSCVRLVVYVTDMYRWRPLVNQVQAELWGQLNGTGKGFVQYPPRTIVEVQRLNDDDIVEVEGTFWLGDDWRE